MADNVTETGKKVLIGTHVEPEIASRFENMAKAMHMDKAKLLRLLIDRAFEEAEHVQKIAAKVSKHIHQVAK